MPQEFKTSEPITPDNIHNIPSSANEIIFIGNFNNQELVLTHLPDNINKITVKIPSGSSQCQNLAIDPQYLYHVKEIAIINANFKSFKYPIPFQLETFKINGSVDKIPPMEVISSGLQPLGPLRTLILHYSNNIDSIPHELVGGLENLDLSNCESIEALAHNLKNLKRLKLQECGSIQFLPHLPKLEELTIEGCKNLKLLSVPNNLKSLTIEGCDPLSTFRGSLSVDQLKIHSSNLKELPPISKVLFLRISDCPSLRKVPKIPSDFRYADIDLSRSESIFHDEVQARALLELKEKHRNDPNFKFIQPNYPGHFELVFDADEDPGFYLRTGYKLFTIHDSEDPQLPKQLKDDQDDSRIYIFYKQFAPPTPPPPAPTTATPQARAQNQALDRARNPDTNPAGAHTEGLRCTPNNCGIS